MISKRKIFVSFATIATLGSLSFGNLSASADTQNNESTNTFDVSKHNNGYLFNNTNDSKMSIKDFEWAVGKKAASGLGGWVLNKVYNVSPDSEASSDGFYTTPGTVWLNHGNKNAMAELTVNAASTSHSVAAAFNSPFVMFGSNMAIQVRNPHGNITFNDSTTPGQYRGFQFGLKGKYHIDFIATDSMKVQPFANYSKSNVYKGMFNSVKEPVNASKEIDLSKQDPTHYSNLNNYGTTKKPTWGNNKVNEGKSSLNAKDFYNQFVDKDGNSVLSMKDYKDGDSFTINDIVKNSEYNSDKNETNVYFNSDEDSTHYLKFNGNLTNKFTKGSSFSKEMKVTKLGNNDEFRLPTYFQYLKNNQGQAPKF